MVPGRDFRYVNQRLQQGFSNSEPFGGIPIAWIGDPGQIPPVVGTSAWCNI